MLDEGHLQEMHSGVTRASCDDNEPQVNYMRENAVGKLHRGKAGESAIHVH